MNQNLKITIAATNVVNRILVFYFFWLASNEVGSVFNDRRLAYQNEVWAWQQNVYSDLVISHDECASTQTLVSSYEWPGRQRYKNASTSVNAYAPVLFDNWTISGTSFRICGTQLNVSFITQASSNLSCASRQQNECGNNISSFCMNPLYSCPITDFSFDTKGNLVVGRNKSTLPMSLIRIDVANPCITSNLTNLPSTDTANPNVLGTQYCTDYDSSYLKVNSITENTYFSINNALTYQNISNVNRTMFYNHYPYWNITCNGDLFSTAINLYDKVRDLIRYSDIVHFMAIIYLLLCNYAIPAVPFMCRCVEGLDIYFFIKIDYLVRIAVFAALIYTSSTVLAICTDIIQDTDTLIGQSCTLTDEYLSKLQDNTQLIFDLNIVAITITLCIKLIELFLIGVHFFNRAIQSGKRFCHRLFFQFRGETLTAKQVKQAAYVSKHMALHESFSQTVAQ